MFRQFCFEMSIRLFLDFLYRSCIFFFFLHYKHPSPLGYSYYSLSVTYFVRTKFNENLKNYVIWWKINTFKTDVTFVILEKMLSFYLSLIALWVASKHTKAEETSARVLLFHGERIGILSYKIRSVLRCLVLFSI